MRGLLRPVLIVAAVGVALMLAAFSLLPVLVR